MLLLDASYINIGGGKILLDELIKEVENSKIKVLYLLDIRYSNKDLSNSKNKVIYIKSNSFVRFYYYFKFRSKINKIFIFSGIPPIYNFKTNTICFFQNVLFYNKQTNYLKFKYFKIFATNINTWIVQTNYIKQTLSKHINSNNIIIAPFFSINYPTIKNNKVYTDNIKLLYVSSGELHKNHLRLFESFNKFLKIYPKAILTITIDNKHANILNHLQKSYNVRNIGFVNNDILYKEYRENDIFIFPSLNESFGLGLIEANKFNLPILASDLPYVKEILDTPYLFNPYNVDSIFECIINCIETNYKLSTLKINNEIDKIIEIIN
jgi:glycosyltransferase involved in cell wall biosynthesis